MLNPEQICAAKAKYQSQLNFAVLDNKKKICPLSKVPIYKCIFQQVLCIMQIHTASKVLTDICIFTEMEASCKNNTKNLILLHSFGLYNQFYPYLEQFL